VVRHFFSHIPQATPMLIFFCIATLFSPPLTAAEEEPVSPPHIDLLEPLDSSRNAVSKQVINFANWLDNFFGDERIFDESQNSHLKLNLLQINEEGFEPRFEANLQGKLTLPNTQKRLKILFESDPGENPNPDDTIVEAVENQQQSLGLRYVQFASDWFRGHTDIGVRFRSGLDTFVRFRLRGLFSLGNWNLRATETIFWRDSTGLGESTRLDFERRFGDNYLFRATSKANWFDETRQFDMGQDFFLIHTINKYRAVIYRAGLSAVSEPKVQATGYILSLRLRQQIHRDWLFFEINPKVLYPQEKNFNAQHSLTFKLEVVFGGI
jgi:hypothetical protein